MPTNEYLPFAYVGGANVMSQPDYTALVARSTGFAAGVAQSVQLNKVWRQSSVMSAAIAEFIMDSTNLDVLDDGDHDALALLFLQAVQSRTRIQLTADLTLYVNASLGNDVTNDGRSALTPFATIQRAWNELFGRIDFNGFSADVLVADGTYTNPVVCRGTPVGIGPNSEIRITGNIAAPASCQINVLLADAFTLNNCAAPVALEGFRITATGSGGRFSNGGTAINCMLAELEIKAIAFGSCFSAHMIAQRGGRITTRGNSYSIVGGAPTHIEALIGAEILTSGSNVALTGTPAFSLAFAHARENGVLLPFSTVYSGAATGVRYNADTNGTIQTFAAGATFLPGNAAGVTSNGGVYV